MKMDIYQCSTYPYNQSEELTKQMISQQSFTSSLSYNRITEPHCMPEPSGAPWNFQNLPWSMSSPPSLVHFTGQQPVTESTFTPVVHCKRKSIDVEPVIPAKQLITEEKMAAHLSGLHISSNYTTHKLAQDEYMDLGLESSTTNLSERLKGHTIVLADEIKKLKDEPLLPPSIIEKLEKPCMSLIVWKPKEDILEKTLKNDEEKDLQKEEKHVKRNGVLVPEHIGMDVEM